MLRSSQRNLLLIVTFLLLNACTDNAGDRPDQKDVSKDTTQPVNVDDTTSTPPEEILPSDTAQIPTTDTTHVIRLGKHNITLQWISWNKPGTVQIQPSAEGWYSVKGGQEGPGGDYLTIDGELKPVDKLELIFRGRVQYKVSSINAGDTCTKDGEQLFKSTKGRKYWRMQNMASCEVGTIDYIDIYF